MKKILYISPGNRKSKGGIGLCVNNYSKHVAGLKVLVTYRSSLGLLNILCFPLCIVELVYRLISDRKIEIVHIHGASKGSFYRKYILFLLIRWFSRKKIIYHVHGGGFKEFYLNSPSFVQKRVRHLIQSADMVICLSERWKHFFSSTFCPQRIEIVNNMVSPPCDIPEKRTNGIVNLLFLGLIGDNKGIFDLLKVMARNKAMFKGKVKLTIAGNGAVNRLKARIKEWELEGMVDFVGWADAAKKDDLLRSSQIFVLPSYKEGLPLSILEAMSYGLPIISSNVGGVPDLINKYRNGIMVEPGNSAEIKEAILKLANNKDLLQVFSQRSANGAADFYPQSVVKKLLSIYHELQESKRLLVEQD